MSRHTVTVLRILAVGSALTILACQIVNRQQQAVSAAGDPGTPGVEAKKQTWADSSKSARMISPGEIEKSDLVPLFPPGESAAAPAAPTAATAPPQASPPPAPASTSPAPIRPAPTHVRGFGSKSGPAITPADIKQMRQQIQQGNQPGPR